MKLKLDSSKYFSIPYSVFDVLLQMRGAIDPDSGQIVCHFYTLGVAALETGDSAVPVIVLEGCLLATFGKENIEAVLKAGEAVEVNEFRVNRGRIAIGDLEVDHYWGLAAIAYAGETGADVKLYKLRVVVDGEEAPVAAILVDPTDAGPMLMMLPKSCEYIEEQEQPPTHM
ncbi:hypothetical protein Pyrde_0676 [Pyrodictium delaneyi]|uniref:Uncharacterized protein n=1 Tax=Pyrodictium delaneyi TaxID=1273541 RepID=A0A0P0N347_9CREN|nr:hypothetical protein [Pyrodictium delaneyi]ALL00726.1 hypothetical protein Pyrde_0676 [Pyrodictium delaneyi]OWJ54165.1 hypothetical protein Pdsh_09990 [Pyrodictium delaneyi]